ncbi:MAG: hypothetical protein LBP23_00540 [Treponema sp.]|jgi:hypothetical protein|nr:hypothetical protein [Treponema sp.]
MGLAIDDFTKAIECDPGMADAWRNRGIVHCARARESRDMIKAITTQKTADDAERAVLLAHLEHKGAMTLSPR